MRAWDITDQLFPGIQITERPAKKVVFRAVASSVARMALAVGFVVTTAGNFTVRSSPSASAVKTTVSLVIATPLAHPAEPRLTRGSPRDTDTQYGRSTSKLSEAFSAFFEPAQEEEAYEDDYSFS